MGPQQQPDYNFILQGGANSPRISSPKTQKQRIIFVAFITGAVLVVGLVLMILVNLFTVDNGEKLTKLATQQNEVQKIMDLGVSGSASASVKGAAQTASSTLASHKQAVISVAKDKNIKISEKKLESLSTKKIERTEAVLATAKSANTFDEEFTQIYEAQLTEYLLEVRKLSSTEKDKKIKAALQNFEKQLPLLSTKYVAKTTD